MLKTFPVMSTFLLELDYYSWSNKRSQTICDNLNIELFDKILETKKYLKSFIEVAWLHSEKGIIAVYPDMVAQNDRFTSKYDNR